LFIRQAVVTYEPERLAVSLRERGNHLLDDHGLPRRVDLLVDAGDVVRGEMAPTTVAVVEHRGSVLTPEHRRPLPVCDPEDPGAGISAPRIEAAGALEHAEKRQRNQISGVVATSRGVAQDRNAVAPEEMLERSGIIFDPAQQLAVSRFVLHTPY
jgi:hypothetical protein